jgi:hypothetical protein
MLLTVVVLVVKQLLLPIPNMMTKGHLMRPMKNSDLHPTPPHTISRAGNSFMTLGNIDAPTTIMRYQEFDIPINTTPQPKQSTKKYI